MKQSAPPRLGDLPQPQSMLAASVIVVSRQRLRDLRCALAALALSDHPCFEVICVLDPETAAILEAEGVAEGYRILTCAEANISRARNIGLRAARAPVVAFLDDDALPEPSWLRALVSAFADSRVVQAGGFVRDRSGFHWQSKARLLDRSGCDYDWPEAECGGIYQNCADFFVKTEGTNCAFRRDALLAIGGFDPAFRFYLDEADVNLRLSARGGASAVVPSAQVSHGLAASERRRADRVPMSLLEVGASVAYFLRRHGADLAAGLQRHFALQRARLLRHLITGALEPCAVEALLKTYEAGVSQGLTRALMVEAPLPAAPDRLCPLPQTGPRRGVVIEGRKGDLTALRAQAAQARAAGHVVTLVALRRGFGPQVMQFNPAGWWEITGGRFGRLGRDEAAAFWQGLSARRRHRLAVIAKMRPIS